MIFILSEVDMHVLLLNDKLPFRKSIFKKKKYLITQFNQLDLQNFIFFFQLSKYTQK